MSDKRSEVDVLFPDRDVKLSDGRVVHVRELTFGETLELQRRPGFAEFITAVHALAEPGEVPDSMSLVMLGADHVDWWCEFLLKVTGLSTDEIASMRPIDGARVQLTAVTGNAGFFAVAVRMHRPASTTTTPSPTPSPSSSDTDTTTPAP